MGEMVDEKDGVKTVHINMWANGRQFCGDVAIDVETNSVSLGDLLKDYSEYARYDGKDLCPLSAVLVGEALHEAGEGFDYAIEQCAVTDYWVDSSYLKETRDGEYAFTCLTQEYDGDTYLERDGAWEYERDGDGDRSYEWRPKWYWEDRHYCDHCGCYIRYDGDWDYDYEECVYCRENERSSCIIEQYGESHEHEPVFFGSYKGEFAGLGFELEVDCDRANESNNESTAEGLCSYCGLDDDEMRYAHDGSLVHGFECISQPHTVKDFWDKQDRWCKMLSYLANHGYTSHDAGTCGLHVHVSRTMFGRTKEAQELAIAKVYTFFDENWDAVCRISRRKDFGYCAKNHASEVDLDAARNKVDAWKKSQKKSCARGHYVALNNANSATFEYRLGRGTLNAWSFFSWIDFIITITKNAKRISANKVVTNDLLSWLGGIKESTAKYIYKRGAFRREMVALFPNIEWETDLTDNSDC